jgi:hypothetical protein
VDRRRFLLTSVAGVLVAPLTGEAQQAKVYRIGQITPEMPTRPLGQGPFWDRMRELGWVYGQNVVGERRVYGADPSRIPEITSELISLGTDVFVVPNGTTARGVQRRGIALTCLQISGLMTAVRHERSQRSPLSMTPSMAGSGRAALESTDLAERGAQWHGATQRISDVRIDQRVVVRRARPLRRIPR